MPSRTLPDKLSSTRSRSSEISVGIDPDKSLSPKERTVKLLMLLSSAGIVLVNILSYKCKTFNISNFANSDGSGPVSLLPSKCNWPVNTKT
jgi:hypothetical protein